MKPHAGFPIPPSNGLSLYSGRPELGTPPLRRTVASQSLFEHTDHRNIWADVAIWGVCLGITAWGFAVLAIEGITSFLETINAAA